MRNDDLRCRYYLYSQKINNKLTRAKWRTCNHKNKYAGKCMSCKTELRPGVQHKCNTVVGNVMHEWCKRLRDPRRRYYTTSCPQCGTGIATRDMPRVQADPEYRLEGKTLYITYDTPKIQIVLQVNTHYPITPSDTYRQYVFSFADTVPRILCSGLETSKQTCHKCIDN